MAATSPPSALSAAELREAIDASLEPALLFAEDEYNKALSEASSSLTVLEAIDLLESRRFNQDAAELKDALCEALAEGNPYRVAYAHTTAVGIVEHHGLRHDLNLPVLPGTPIRPRMPSSLRNPERHVTIADNPGIESPRMRSIVDNTQYGRARARQRIRSFAPLSDPRFSREFMDRISATSCVIWFLLFLAVGGVILWMVTVFSQKRAEPLIQINTEERASFEMPYVSVCFGWDSFPATAGFDINACAVTEDEDEEKSVSCFHGRERPTFMIDQVKRFRQPQPGDGPKAGIRKAFRATGDKESIDLCKKRLSAFDVRIQEELRDETAREGRLVCEACLQVQGGNDVELIANSRAPALSYRAVTDRFAPFCFAPKLRALLWQARGEIAKEIVSRIDEFKEAGVLQISPDVNVSAALNGSLDPSDPAIFARPLPADALSIIDRVEVTRQSDEVLCNLWYFSGVVFPAVDPNIFYVYEPSHYSNISGLSNQAGWAKAAGSGPYFALSSSLASGPQSATIGLPNTPRHSDASDVPLHVFLSGDEDHLPRDSPYVIALVPDGESTLIIQPEINVEGEIRYTQSPLSSLRIAGFSRSSTAWVESSARSRLLVSFEGNTAEVVTRTAVVTWSQLLADVANLIEMTLGITLISVLVYFASYPLQG